MIKPTQQILQQTFSICRNCTNVCCWKIAPHFENVYSMLNNNRASKDLQKLEIRTKFAYIKADMRFLHRF